MSTEAQRPARAFRGVYHGATFALDASGDDALPKTWNQIAKYGDFSGHAAGPFAFDEDVFATIIRNFYATANRAVPVDYEHGTEQTDPSSSIYQDGAPAVAFIRELQSRGEGGLWGLFEWVDPQAVQYVRQGRYRFFSPAVVFDAVDGASGAPIGAKLVSGGLTNRPFLDGMEPLAARDAAPATQQSLPPSAVHIDGAIGRRPSENKTMADVNQDGQINKVMARVKQALKSAFPKRAAMDDDADAAAMDDAGTSDVAMDDDGSGFTLGDVDAMDDGALMDALDAMAARMRKLDDASLRASRKAAMDDVSMRAEAYGWTTRDAKRAALTMRARDPKGFAALFPAKAGAPKPEAKPEPTRDERLAALRDAARLAGASDDAVTLLTASIAPKPPLEAEAKNPPANKVDVEALAQGAAGGEPDPAAAERADVAQRVATIMRDNPSVSHTDAITLAHRARRAEAQKKIDGAITRTVAGA